MFSEAEGQCLIGQVGKHRVVRSSSRAVLEHLALCGTDLPGFRMTHTDHVDGNAGSVTHIATQEYGVYSADHDVLSSGWRFWQKNQNLLCSHLWFKMAKKPSPAGAFSQILAFSARSFVNECHFGGRIPESDPGLSPSSIDRSRGAASAWRMYLNNIYICSWLRGRSPR